ncbi:hypothetical protein ACFY15_34255 [Streptomyces sp. NPDC001373]|uniref:hypothetical protein n=1 Tax=Streptomyces sp. NPDC001373 TaxID=3364565 RepID=UPI00367BE53E
MGELPTDHTTLRLGGPTRRWFTHTDPAAWPDLAADAGYDGTVIRMATLGITSAT